VSKVTVTDSAGGIEGEAELDGLKLGEVLILGLIEGDSLPDGLVEAEGEIEARRTWRMRS
jgi:hypothetical protein